MVEERDRIEKALKASSVVTRDDRETRLEAARSNDNDRSIIPSTPYDFATAKYQRDLDRN